MILFFVLQKACNDAGFSENAQAIVTSFTTFDADKSGAIDSKELEKVLKELGETPSSSQIQAQIKEVDADGSGQIEFNEFLTVMKNLAKGKSSIFGRTVQKQGDINLNMLKSEHATHSFSDEEKIAFTEYVNDCLGDDPDCAHFMPLEPTDMSLFPACRDGILLCKLINDAVPGTIDERVLNKANKSKGVLSPRGGNTMFLNQHQAVENLNLGVASAKSIGCTVVNVGASDITECREHVILGLIWQIIRIGLLASINLQDNPALFKLLEEGETLQDLMRLPPDQILVRWVNYHLREAGDARRIKGFGKNDIGDSHVYTIVLNQIAPKGKGVTKDPLKESDGMARATAMLAEAEKIKCRRFVKPKDVVSGNKKLNLAFVANLFNTYPGLGELDDDARKQLEDIDWDSEGSREKRAFTLWINSLGCDGYLQDLYLDLWNGLWILKVEDAIRPQTVEWSKVVTKDGMNKFQAIGNCNYAVDLAKSPFNLSVVGIGGSDINACNEKLILAIVWQLMRWQIITILEKLGGGKKIDDGEIIRWANAKVKDAGSSRQISGFKDESLQDGLFLIELANAVRPDLIAEEHIDAAPADEDAMKENAKLLISSVRKAGAAVFLLPEDIVESKDKLIMTLAASIMTLDFGNTNKK